MLLSTSESKKQLGTMAINAVLPFEVALPAKQV